METKEIKNEQNTNESEVVILDEEVQKDGKLAVTDNTNEVIKYDFARVDMDEPTTILSYGQEVQDAVVDILKSTAQMSVNQEQDFIDEEMIKKITSFDEMLDAADRAAAKEEGPLGRIKKAILSLTGSKALEKSEKMKTYKGRYEDYVNNIESVVEHVEILKQNALADIELRKDIAIQIKPFIEELVEMLRVGKLDKEAYDNETVEISKTDTSIDGQYLVQRRSRISDIFGKKLNNLEKALALYKAQLQEYAMQQNNDMIVVEEADSYITDQAPLLQAQGSTQIFNRIQTDRITSLQTLNDASNVAIQNNALAIEGNTKAAVDLMVNGGFSVESLVVVQKSLQNGANILESGKKLLKDKLEKDQKALGDINALLDENQEKIISLIEDTAVAVQQVQDSSTQHVKRLNNGKNFGPYRH